jgi:hypothetical protein
LVPSLLLSPSSSAMVQLAPAPTAAAATAVPAALQPHVHALTAIAHTAFAPSGFLQYHSQSLSSDEWHTRAFGAGVYVPLNVAAVSADIPNWVAVVVSTLVHTSTTPVYYRVSWRHSHTLPGATTQSDVLVCIFDLWWHK